MLSTQMNRAHNLLLDLLIDSKPAILLQIASKDKDFRYMATSDLLNELQKDNFKLDTDTERKVSQIVLQQLDDASGDISGLAVKW